METIHIRDFINNSHYGKKLIATYKTLQIVSAGEGGNRHVYFYQNGEEVLYMWVDTHCDSACFVHSERGKYANILQPIYSKYARFDGWFNIFKTWDEFEEFFMEVINRIR